MGVLLAGDRVGMEDAGAPVGFGVGLAVGLVVGLAVGLAVGCELVGLV